jgi:hypothetical protein
VKFFSAKLVNQVGLSVLLLIVCFALTGSSAAQNQYYVNANSGSDSNDGSQARPWKTIGHADSAISVGSGGAVIHVAPGSYTSAITTNKSGTASGRIVYISDSKWGAKIINNSWQVMGNYTDVNGFDITNPGAGGYAFNVRGSNDHILYNNLHDFTVNGCGQYGVITPGGSDNWFIGNIIRHAGNYNSGANHCVTLHGIYSGGVRHTIQDNIISGITGWGIKSDCMTTTVISNNTLFNNGGGIDASELNDAGFCTIWDYNTVSNNIIVNNGVDVPGGSGRFGINFYHVTGKHNLVTNNLIYGNSPTNYAHHDVACTGGTPISGSDADGTAGGCPSVNPKSDPNTSITFVNFQNDTPSAPASNYNATNYQIKAGSSAVQNGTTNCAASPGLNPCVPTLDIVGIARISGVTLDIGAYEQGSSAETAPSAPTGLTASVQ